MEQKIPLILEHTLIFEQLFPKQFFAIRKHLAWYFFGFPGAADLRQKLVMTSTPEEVARIISASNFLTR